MPLDTNLVHSMWRMVCTHVLKINKGIPIDELCYIGHTSCVLCPTVMKYNAKVNSKRQQRAFDALWSDDYIRNVSSKRGLTSENDLGDLLDGLFREYGMPRSLKEVGVEGQEKLEILSVRSLEDPWCRTNPIPLNTPEQVMSILKLVEA